MMPNDLNDLRTLYRQISRRHSVYEKFAPALNAAIAQLERAGTVPIPKFKEGDRAELLQQYTAESQALDAATDNLYGKHEDVPT